MPRHPQNKTGGTGKKARVLPQGRLLLCADRDQQVSNFELDWVALEKIGQVDEVVAIFGVGIGDEFVVRKREAEDVAVDDDDCFWRNLIADDVRIQAVKDFFDSLGLAFVDRSRDALVARGVRGIHSVAK